MTSEQTTLDAARFAQDRWEEEGRRIAPSLDRVAAVVVVGEDADAAAAVALGIGRVQSRRRRVAIGDLVGEVGPLQSLVKGDDPHGIVDSFLYGVSLNRIARPIDESGNLFVLPSGSEPLVGEEIFRSERWGRLATGFRDVGALLVLVAPSGISGVEALVAQVDGVVLAGSGSPTPAGAAVIAVAEPPSLEVPPAERTSPEPAAPAPTIANASSPRPVLVSPPVVPPNPHPEPDATPADIPTSTERPAARWVRRIAEAPPTGINLPAVAPPAKRAPDAPVPAVGWALPRRKRWPYALAAGLVVALVGTSFLSRDEGTRSEAGRRGVPPRVTTVEAGRQSAPAPGDTDAVGGSVDGSGVATAAGTVAPAAKPPDPPPPVARPLISNPDDSAAAASYSVQIVAANTMDGARAKLRDVALGLPAAVISPMSLGADSTRWYRLTVAAFSDRQAAIAYLVQLRARRKLDLEAENVVRLPFALLLEGRVPRSIAKATASSYASRGLPAYPLLQPDGTARVYAGAFETPEQAGLLAAQLRTSGIEPVVAYRTGRGF